jgi:hypothetical protein
LKAGEGKEPGKLSQTFFWRTLRFNFQARLQKNDLGLARKKRPEQRCPGLLWLSLG